MSQQTDTNKKEEHDQKPVSVIFYGPQGSGKGTQAKLLKEYLENSSGPGSVFQSDTGSHFRELIKKAGSTPDKVRATINRGDLQPAFLAAYMWSKDMIENLTDDQHIIIDGSPRSLPEALVLDTAMKFYGRSPVIIEISLSETESINRLLERGREDDTQESIKNRLQQYAVTSAPAVDHLAKIPGYTKVTINGQQSVETVFAEVLQALRFNNS